MKGIIKSGEKKGGKYVSMDEYRKQFMEKLKIEPYPGTLNVEVDEEIKRDLKKINGITINGFIKNGKKYGRVNCFPVDIEGMDGAILIPERSRHRNIVEIISNRNLRKELHLNDGEELQINFKPFIKEMEKIRIYARPFEGREESNITIYYDPPFGGGRRDLCFSRKNRNSYRKVISGKNIGTILFEGDGEREYEILMKWIKENGYSLLSPVRKIKYRKLGEWQVELKIHTL